ncbi:response regulator transcription factor [Luteolibacter arcticus]|uniref:Response regulator transcription factor n=1 Tax=Luteolibacter arcticus TaxID=1581411 RepID=A0ABT3GKH2_9BACT|nr:response regulator transcription factor [Luteolibacter arcticus]MCW1924001.1 response regulator transcription factor [Luteolibacter arcticus]
MPISVAIVEDNVEIREMLTRTVERAASLTFLNSYPSGEEALEHLPTLKPDVVIMDIQLPGISGIECTVRLKAIAPEIQVLVFTVFGDADLVFKALEAGASGYMLKRTPRQEIVDAVKDVWFGGAPMSGEIARKVVESFRKPPKAKDADLEQLTNREEEVLALLAKGYITKEIADQMGISFDTVRFHLKHIYQKLHVRSRSEALIKYLK